MDVKNCKGCGRLFNYVAGPPLCPACREELEKKFQQVKAYICDNKNATVAMVAEECDVSEKQIKQWVREERLVFYGGIDAGIYCETCGEPIDTGRFCPKCKANVVNGFNEAMPKAEPKPLERKNTKENPRMRFLDNR